MKLLIFFAMIGSLLALSKGAAVQSSDAEIVVVTTDGVSNGDGRLRRHLDPAAALHRSVAERHILTQGTIGSAAERVFETILEWNSPNLVHTDISYRRQTPITGIQVTELGDNPHTTAAIVEGGVGQVHATVRIAIPGSNQFFVRIVFWA